MKGERARESGRGREGEREREAEALKRVYAKRKFGLRVLLMFS